MVAIPKEKSFPRGGREHLEDPKQKGPRQRRTKPLLFGRKSKDQHKNKRGKKVETDEQRPFLRIRQYTGPLRYTHITEDMLILGCIYKIEQYQIGISLPGNCTGFVPITNISEHYTQALGSVMKNTDIDGVPPIRDLFKIGQHVVTKVVKKEVHEGSNRNKIVLSLAPDVIHSDCSSEDILKESVFTAAVKSIEEKGYIMDLGIKTVRAFLKKENAEKFEEIWNNGKRLVIGQLVRCLVTKVSVANLVSTVVLTSDPELVAKASSNTQGTTLQAMLPGMLFDVTVSRRVFPPGIQVRLSDNILGYIHEDHFSKTFKKPEHFEVGSVQAARVLYISQSGTIFFTMKNGICDAQPPTSPFEAVKAGEITQNTVIMSTSDAGLTVRIEKVGEKALKGFIPLSHTNRKDEPKDEEFDIPLTEKLATEFPIGAQLTCRVLEYNYMDQYYFCTMDEALMKEKYVHPNSLKVGLVLSCIVKQISQKGIIVMMGKKSTVSGFVPILHVSDVPLHHPEKKFNVGQTCQARVLSIEDSNIQLTMKQSLIHSKSPLLARIEDVKIGTKYAGTIVLVTEKGILVSFYAGIKGWVPTQLLSSKKIESSEIAKTFYKGQVVYCTVIKTDTATQKIVLSLIEKSDLKNTSDIGKLLVVNNSIHSTDSDSPTKKKKKRKRKKKSNTIDTIINDIEIKSEPEDEVEEEDLPIDKATEESANDETALGLGKTKRKKKLSASSVDFDILDCIVNAGKDSHKKKKKKPVDTTFDILDADAEIKSEVGSDVDDAVMCSSQSEVGSCAKKMKKEKKKKTAHATFEILDADAEIKSEVYSDVDDAVMCSSQSEVSSSSKKIKNEKKKKTAHATFEILDVGPKKTKLTSALEKGHTNSDEHFTVDASVTNGTKTGKKRKLQATKSENIIKKSKETHETADEKSSSKSEKIKKIKVEALDSEDDEKSDVALKPVELPPLSVATGFVWDATPDLLPAVAVASCEDESSDEDLQVSKKVKRSRQAIIAEKRAQAQLEEARLREVEQRLMDPEQLPQTADEFDRLVLSSPNSSMVWLQYMAHHLQATEIEKARTVAQRALKTISFREEQEKLNVWVAWLNLENLYGTKETLDTTLEEAIRLNDPYQVYTQMLQIYADSHKLQDADSLIGVMTRKFKLIKDMWLNVATFYMKSGQMEKGRSLLQRALASLEKKEHVSVISRFALLENKLGSNERAQTLMEQILTSYPKRVDVWSAYVDMLVKSNLFTLARQVLERAVAQRLPSHKMKTLFKKFLAFEERHGTEEGANKVRQLALAYVEAATGAKIE